jgi:hypothetical protein
LAIQELRHSHETAMSLRLYFLCGQVYTVDPRAIDVCKLPLTGSLPSPQQSTRACVHFQHLTRTVGHGGRCASVSAFLHGPFQRRINFLKAYVKDRRC